MSFGSPAKVVSCDTEHIFAFNLYSLGGSICHPLTPGKLFFKSNPSKMFQGCEEIVIFSSLVET